MLAIGERAPNFEGLPGTDGRQHSLASYADKPVLVVIFSCNHCPYVQAYESRMISIQNDYAKKGVKLVAINSNDEKVVSGDSFPDMVQRAKDKGFNFDYLKDESQSVVDDYGGICTPHIFAFDDKRVLRYRGRIDDSKDIAQVKSHDLRNALDDITNGRQVRVSDTKPFGCSIKWREE